MLITNNGVIIRTKVNEIPVYGRSAGGVIVMRLDEGASIVGFARVKEDKEETEKSDLENTDSLDEETSGSDSDGNI